MSKARTSHRSNNRWAENHPDRLPALAADLIRLRVGLIVASGIEAARRWRCCCWWHDGVIVLPRCDAQRRGPLSSKSGILLGSGAFV
jgi:hypothetical protein